MITFDLAHIDEAASACWTKWSNVSIIAFHGLMGSGKTTLIKAMCKVKGVQDTVSSPTFSIINEYAYLDEKGATQKIFHLDLYRLKDVQEAINAGVEDCFNQQGICLIEWPEIIEPILPDYVIHLYLEVLPDGKRAVKTH